MAIRSRIIPRLGLVVSQASGVLTWADLRGNRSNLASHPEYSPSYALLFDLRRVTRMDLNADQIRDHAGFGNVGEPNYARVAIVVSEDVVYGLARIFQAYASHRYDDHTLQVFRDAEAAWRWVREAAPD